MNMKTDRYKYKRLAIETRELDLERERGRDREKARPRDKKRVRKCTRENE